jgi:hypothetical protein
MRQQLVDALMAARRGVHLARAASDKATEDDAHQAVIKRSGRLGSVGR